MEAERRKHPRVETTLPIHFNLNPDYHYVPTIRKLGVAGTIRNMSREGLGLYSRMDLLDVCQIFTEAIEGDSIFALEVSFMDSKGEKALLKGEVRWYQVSESEGDIRQFQAGLHLKDVESQAVLKSMRLG